MRRRQTMCWLTNTLSVFFSVVCCLWGFIGCSSLPKDIHRPPSSVIKDGHTTRLGRTFAEALAGHSGQSGVILLSNGLDARAEQIEPACQNHGDRPKGHVRGFHEPGSAFPEHQQRNRHPVPQPGNSR
ncbi:hypothetical protein DESC_610015 [Desulfosarcina cetonica]|nr:hypothetical protein DESC_610015 [Desulfosarcina cetonica]